MSARSSQRSSFNGSPRHLTVEEMNQLSIRSLEELNQLSQATREFGEVYSGSPDASRRSPKFLQRLFDPLESRSDAECLFRVRISGIQCRNLQGRRFSGKSDPFVEFYWDDPEEKAPYATPVIKADLNPNYKGVLIAFEYKATLNALPKRFLWVKVFSNRKFHAKSVIGQTKVDLWSVATGPVHHDHHLIGCDNGRVVFNCYMEQCSEWNISVSDVGVMMPAIANELDRPEGHDFQEDASLPLKKFGVSYKCTIGTNEKFYMGNKLKHAIKREIGDIQEPKGEAGTEDEVAADSLVAQDPMGVQWATSSDYLPPITRYSTFDELMSATLTLEVRQLLVGRGQMSTDPDGGFLSLLEKYKKDTLATPNTDVQFDEEIKNTILFGQTWLSLEKIFEDALQERMKKKYDADPGQGMNGLGFSEQFVTSKFEQSLTLKGHQVGVIYGTILFKRIPDVRQLRCGVNSENGISSSSSVIVGTAAAGSKKNLRKSKVVIPVEAQRVLEKMQDLVELMANRQKDDKEGKVRKATKILKMLQVSHKASMLSWVYVSAEALEETKNILLRLWQFLLENIRVRHYTLRNVFYELLFYLVKRAELSDLPLLGFDSTVVTTVLGTKHTHKVSKKDLEFGLKLRAMLVETKFCVLQTVSVRGVMNNNLMFFVARMLSVLCFRLPSFGVELYQLWSESYNEPVPELAAEFRMNADADLFAMDGLEAHLDWRRFHKAIFDEYGEKALRHQEEEAEDKYEVTSEAWKSRFRRLNGEANTLNILLVDQWLTKTRSISEDYVKHPIPPQPKMDSNIQTKFNRLLESIYIAAKKYIDQQSESGNLLRRQTMKATWKKKGMLLKQGFIYKNTWKNKYFSLQNNKLGYGDSEHGPIKREINVIGSVVSEMSNQLDHSQGTRVVLFNCFSVDSGYQKFVLCAPTFEEQREWIEVLTQNATAETAERKDNETLSQLDLAEVAGQLESLAGKNTTNDEVPENLLPYSVLAVKEWLNLRVTAMEIEGKIAAGQPFQMPVLLSKSSLYADDD
ncbi:duf1765 domain containing protein [Phytophthora cinnamomi]|uniref:duf1765 domain containing protein n=1 Tax=Phytophthora cinnamomi TaxID=4785 RepID=UPI0035594FB6|nr:duf1765 domain containing protein [Phytophthora cinnamomi]